MSNNELILTGKVLDLLKVSTFPKRGRGGVTLSKQALRVPDQNVWNLNAWRWVNFAEMHTKLLN